MTSGVLPVKASPRLGALNPLTSWDGQWYISIAEKGYHAAAIQGGGAAGRHDFAFFPLWPIVVRIGSLNGLLPMNVVAVVLANVLAIAAALVVYRVIARAWDPATGLGAVALLSFAPAAYTFSMAYSEPLLLLLVASWFLLEHRPFAATWAAAFAAVSRITGAMLVPAALYRAWHEFRSPEPDRRARNGAILSILGGGAGFALWWCSIWGLTGDFMGFMQGSPAWVKESGLSIVLTKIGQGNIDTFVRLGIAGVVIVGSVLAVRRNRELGIFALATALLGTLPGGLVESVPRYVLPAFPAFAGLAAGFGKRGTPFLVVAFALLQVWLTLSAFTTAIGPIVSPP